MELPRIKSIGTAVPPHAIKQDEIKLYTTKLFSAHFEQLERYLTIFDNSYIHTRYLSQPMEWYGTDHSFAEANEIFEKVALDLAEAAALQALERAGIQKEEIGMVIFVSTTGIVTPSLDGKIIQRLNLSPHTARLPIWGLGCAGGTAGLARAAELAASLTAKYVLLVTVELCSLTFQRNDYSKSNLVGASLFGDGAAAAIIGVGDEGIAIRDSYSTLFSNTENIMGWDLIDTGLKVRFSKNIPSIVNKYLPNLINEACAKWSINKDMLKHYIVHPGGAKVLSAYQESLDLASEQLLPAYSVLADYGNMSSATVFFVLERLMDSKETGTYGIMLALGPGFSAEQVLLQW